MSETARIADLLEETFEGKPYYGPSVIDSLREVGAHLAARRVTNAHSIWELVIHLTAELRYARALLERTAESWVEGETTWRTVMETSPAAWRDAFRNFSGRIVRSSTRSRTSTTVSSPRERSPWSARFTWCCMGRCNNVYHSGQIALLAGRIAHGETEHAD